MRLARGLAGLLFLLFALVLSSGFAGAVQKGSGLPVPRFVSLAADEVNVRTGPGKRYPVGWIYVRQGLPMMVIDEYEDWRRVMDSDGAVGWVHKALLSGRRTALVSGATRPLFQEPDPTSQLVLLAEPEVQGRLLSCKPAWCQLEIDGRRGWMQRAHIFGVLNDEVF